MARSVDHKRDFNRTHDRGDGFVWRRKDNSNSPHQQNRNHHKVSHSVSSSEKTIKNPSTEPFTEMKDVQSFPSPPISQPKVFPDQQSNEKGNQFTFMQHPILMTDGSARQLNDFAQASHSTRITHKNLPTLPSENQKTLHSAKVFNICKETPSRHLNENTILRSGMVLLRNFLTPMDQIFIVNKCNDIGSGPSGFHQPSYKSGAKLRLQMMCLGKYWDTETGKYFERRPFDDSKPPDILPEFTQLVKNSVGVSRALILEEDEEVERFGIDEILPQISPDICIVNFYTTNGRLGLHRDRDESKESLRNGLPVVSFSIGDSAEFLYGDDRDVEKASSVVLKSGDCLIFGGMSRHVFHGVASIIPNSAPSFLSYVIGLRPGRLNLTFRQY